MRITCSNCATSYEVSAASLGPTGRSVRCVRCQHVWFAANTEALASVAAAHRADVAELAAASSVAIDPPPEPPAPETAIDEPSGAPLPNDAQPEEAQNPTSPESAAADVASPEAAPEPTVVADAPPLAPSAEPERPQPQEPPPSLEDIETVAARRARQEKRRRRALGSSMTTAILALLAANIGLVAWRADVVRWLPQTASFYAAIGLPVNLRGLVFTGVTTERETDDGVQVLVVEGTIANTTQRAVVVPRLRFALRNSTGQEIYNWTVLPAKNVLTPGDTLSFRSRLASPPPEGSQVIVRFFNRRDLVAGAQ